MNFALSAIILAILLLPGASVLRAYYTSIKEKKSTIHIPFTELLLRGLVLSFIIHSTALCILKIFDKVPKFQLLYDVTIGREISFDDTEFKTAFLQFCFYNIVLIIILFVLTKILKTQIQKYNLDIQYNSLQNTNYWFQIFSARYLENSGVAGEREKTDLIFLDVLVNTEVVYSGFLLDFNYSPQKDQLENIILGATRKRGINKSDVGHATTKPTHIPGDVFVIPAERIYNINIYYVNLEKVNAPKQHIAEPS